MFGEDIQSVLKRKVLAGSRAFKTLQTCPRKSATAPSPIHSDLFQICPTSEIKNEPRRDANKPALKASQTCLRKSAAHHLLISVCSEPFSFLLDEIASPSNYPWSGLVWSYLISFNSMLFENIAYVGSSMQFVFVFLFVITV